MNRQVKQSFSIKGYQNDSPDKDNVTNTIPGGNISMNNVPHPVMAFPQKGGVTTMYPGNDYQFPGSAYVQEIPIKNNDMAKKGFSVPGYKYGGNKPGAMAIIPDNNPYGQSTSPIPVEYKRTMNGMMQMGGNYLDFMELNPITAQMQHGGPTTNYAPVNQDNNKIEFINDKRGYSNMQTPGQHYTNEGFKKSTGSTMNGASWSKFGGPQFQQQMPIPNEYAYLANGGYIDKYNTGGQAEQGGFATNGPMIYEKTPEMKDGGIHIKKSHEGRFSAYKERTGKTTEEALHSKDPHVRKMANFAKQAAKWSKKEFGGTLSPEHPLSKFIKMYQEGGSVTADDPGGQGTQGATTMETAPETAEGNTQAGQQAQQDMGTAYNPGTDPNNPVNQNQPVMNADQSQNSPSPNTQGAPAPPKTTTRDVYGNLLGAGLTAASFFEDKRNQRNAAGYNRQQGITDNVFGAQRMNTQGQKGDYNQQGVFRPNSYTTQQQGVIYPQMKTGGYIADIPDSEISRLKKLGYKIETL